jgi:transposase
MHRTPSPTHKHRKTSLTPKVQSIIVEAIEKGNYANTACWLAGISDVTYYHWKQRGERGEEPYASFLKAVKEAEAKAEADALKIITEAARNSWQAAAWYLERKKPDKWGRKERATKDDKKAAAAIVEFVESDKYKPTNHED